MRAKDTEASDRWHPCQHQERDAKAKLNPTKYWLQWRQSSLRIRLSRYDYSALRSLRSTYRNSAGGASSSANENYRTSMSGIRHSCEREHLGRWIPEPRGDQRNNRSRYYNTNYNADHQDRQHYSRMAGRGGPPLTKMERDCKPTLESDEQR